MSNYQSEYNLFFDKSEQPEEIPSVSFAKTEYNKTYHGGTPLGLDMLQQVSQELNKIVKKNTVDACQIGMHLQFLKENVDFDKTDYKGYEDYAYKEFGLNRRTAYTYRQIFLHYSGKDKDGSHTGKLDKQWQGYSITLLALLADLTPEERSQFTSKTSCKEVLEYKQAKRQELVQEKKENPRASPDVRQLVEPEEPSMVLGVSHTDLICIFEFFTKMLEGKKEKDIAKNYRKVLSRLFDRMQLGFEKCHDVYLADLCQMYSSKLEKEEKKKC